MVPEVNRLLVPGAHPLAEVVPGLLRRPALSDVALPLSPWTVWRRAVVYVLDEPEESYPMVSASTGAVLMPDSYLRSAPADVLYLDVVHELVHVRQWLQGRRLYHKELPYSRWPTEIEAYRVALREARRLGRDSDWCWRYLHVPWMDEAQWHELGRACGLSSDPPTGPAPPGAFPGT